MNIKSYITVIVIVGLIFSGAGMPLTSMAQEDGQEVEAGIVPGDFFYAFDKLGEAIRAFFAFSPESKARLQARFMDERVAEIKAIIRVKGVEAEELDEARERLSEHAKKVRGIVDKEKEKGNDIHDLVGEVLDDFHTKRDAAKDAFREALDEYLTQKEELLDQLHDAIQAGDTEVVDQIRQQLEELEQKKDEAEQKKDETLAALEAEKDQLLDDADEEKQEEIKEEDDEEKKEEDKEDAEEDLAEINEEKALLLDIVGLHSLTLPEQAFLEFDSLVSQAQAAFDAGEFKEAKEFIDDAEEELEKIEDLIDELKDEGEDKNDHEDDGDRHDGDKEDEHDDEHKDEHDDEHKDEHSDDKDHMEKESTSTDDHE